MTSKLAAPTQPTHVSPTQNPEISVVIPTRNRPGLVTRAVRSALDQTFRDIEVVVVVDGPDDATSAALAAISDCRLRVVLSHRPQGAPGARNWGIREARGKWVALLDDDDEWHPDKLAVQWELARRSPVANPIVISRLVMRTPRADLVLPRRLPGPDEALCEYFTVRRGLFHGDGFIQTSTIMAPTALLRRVGFTPGLPRCQELDWALRALEYEGVDLVIAPEALVRWHADEDRERISSSLPYQKMLEWLRSSRSRLTPRAYAALAMSVISSIAAPSRSPRAFWTLLREATRYGQPCPIDYLTFLQVWLIPQEFRRRLRDLVKGRRQQLTAQPTTQPVRESV
ncbi:MAG TPA: glycosyltransferase family 2 protein [Micromonosporaceae bacterium]|nr:glycosyltransferase family 2 protein [Micromonosporaceae bacterium]